MKRKLKLKMIMEFYIFNIAKLTFIMQMENNVQYFKIKICTYFI